MAGLPRRVDLQDRGRRFVPLNGQYGTIKVINTGNDIRLYFDTTNSWISWKTTDADTGNINTVNATPADPYPTVNWSSANGGTCTATLPGIVTLIQIPGDNVTEISFKKAKKWSNLEIINLINNDLNRLDTYDWPSLNSIDLRNNPNLTYIKTQEWPNLVVLNFSTCNSLGNIDTYNWPNITTLDLSATAMTSFDFRDWPSLQTLCLGTMNMTVFEGKNWPEITQLNCGYGDWTTINTHNSWTKCQTIDFQSNSAPGVTEFVTHPEWIALRNLYIVNHDFATFNTYASWTDLRWLYLPSNHLLESIEVHPEWSTIDYIDIRQCWLITATNIDDILINVDASGSTGVSYRVIDYRLITPAGQAASRSASANTAIANLVAKGWTILYTA